MIIGIGCDVLHIERVYKLLSYKNFLVKYFTKNEINMFRQNIVNEKNYVKKIASNLCVKEALFKSISNEISLFKFSDVEVLRNCNGSPYINLHNDLRKFNEKYNIHVTISNEKNIVTSFVVLEKIN